VTSNQFKWLKTSLPHSKVKAVVFVSDWSHKLAKKDQQQSRTRNA